MADDPFSQYDKWLYPDVKLSSRPPDPRGMIPHIISAARDNGIDPDTAVKVAHSEGLSTFSGDQGKSGGAFQLYTGGGYGNDFQKETGLDPLDPKNEPATIDYALKRAKTEGWGAFHGAANTGIGQWDGIKQVADKAAAPVSDKTAPVARPAPAAPADPFANYEQWIGGPTQEQQDKPGLVMSQLMDWGQDTRLQLIRLNALGHKLIGDDQGMTDLMSLHDRVETAGKAVPKTEPKYDFAHLGDLIQHGSIGDYFDTAVAGLSYAAPSILSLVASGGLAGGLARLTTEAVASGLIGEEGAGLLASTFARRAAVAGTWANLAAQNASTVAGQQYKATGTMDPYLAGGVGAVAGAIGVVPGLAMGGKLTSLIGLGLPESMISDFTNWMHTAIADKLGGGALARAAGGAAAYGAEGLTANALQATVMEAAHAYVDKNYKFLSPQSISNIIGSAVSGGLTSALFGAAAPLHPNQLYIKGQIAKAMGRGDPNHQTLETMFTQPNDKRILDLVPRVPDNNSLDRINQAIRNEFVAYGNYDNIPDSAKEAFGSRTLTIESLSPLVKWFNHYMREEVNGKPYTLPDGSVITPNRSTIDLKNEVMTVHDDIAAKSHDIPLADLPVEQMTQEAFRYLTSRGRSIADVVEPKFAQSGYGVADVGEVIGRRDVHGSYADALSKDQVYMQDSRGRKVPDIKAAKPGIYFSGGVGDTPLFSKTQQVAINFLLKRIMPEAKVIIDTNQNGQPTYPSKRPVGFFTKFGPNDYLVHVDREGGPQGSYLTMTHELGHLITWHQFAKLSPAYQMAIYNLYHNSVRDPTAAGLRDMIQHSGGYDIQRLALLGRDIRTETSFHGWWNFDEFLAEQISKAMLTNKVPFFNKYFENTAFHWRQLLNGLNATGEGFNLKPHEVMSDFFDKIYGQDEPRGFRELADSVLKSSEANAKAMGVKLSVADTMLDRIAKAPPEMSENLGLRNAPQGTVPPGVAAQADRSSWFSRRLWALWQEARLNPHIQSLQNIASYFQLFTGDKMQWKIRTDDSLIAQRKLGKARAKLLNMFEYTMDTMPYLGQNEAARMPVQAEVSVMLRRLGFNNEDWQAIKPVYEARRKIYSDVLDRVEKAAMAAAQRIDDLPTRTARINEISQQMLSMRNRPYFPHSRYGDYYIMIRDPSMNNKKLHYQMFWTQRQAQGQAQELLNHYRATNPNAAIQMGRIPHEFRQFTGLPTPLLDNLRNMPGMTQQQLEWLDNFRFDMSPENSFARRMMRRSGLPGYDMNAARSFANYMNAASGHLARLEYEYPLNQELKNLYASANTDFAPTDIAGSSKRTEMADWASKNIQYVLHPMSEPNAIRSLAFQWYLGFNPSTMFVHLMQMPMFTAPYMSKMYGMASVGRLAKSYLDLRQLYADPAHSTLPPEWLKSQKLLHEQGVMTENRGQDLAAWTDKGLVNRMLQGTKAQVFLQTWSNWSTFLLRHMEQNNRLITGLAAWREAMADPTNPNVAKMVARKQVIYDDLMHQGFTPQTAAAHIAAMEAIQDTHFQYSAQARPEWQKGILKAFTPFMMYKQQAMFFYRHNPANLRALAVLAATSGLMGLPFEQDISDFIKQLSEWAGTRFDPNEEIRKGVAEIYDHPELVMHGFGRDTLGLTALFNAMGVPFPAADISERLGYGRMLPGMREATVDQNETMKERLWEVTKAAFGAGAEVPLNILERSGNMTIPYAYSKIMEGGNWQTLRGWEPAMPAMIRNIEEAIRMAVQGGNVGPKGDIQTPMDITTTAGQSDLLSRLAGVQPTDVAERTEKMQTESQIQAYWDVRRQNITQAFISAYSAKDTQAMKDTMDAVRQFNKDSPLPGVKIKAQELVSKLKNALKQRMMDQLQISRSGVQSLVNPAFPELQPQAPSTGILSAPRQ